MIGTGDKYTFMIFDDSRMGKVRTFVLSRNLLLFLAISLIGIAVLFTSSLYLLHKTYRMRSYMSSEFLDETSDLKAQIVQYNEQVAGLLGRVNALDDLEYKVRDLISLQSGNIPLKPIAVGGREIDILREYSTAAALNEKDFFASLDNTLTALSYEVEKRELTLSELAAALETKRLIMLYTPTLKPVNGWLSSPFGFRESPFTGRQTFHEGIDIAARLGTEVHAAGKGVVIYAGPKSGYGQLVTVDHGYGYMTRYGHNSVLTVQVGDKVEKGEVIAKVGSSGNSTGPHSHYEVLVNGIPVNPLKFIIE